MYSEFLKRDDQTLATRLQQEERLNARKKAAVDVDRARALGGQDGVSYADQDADLDEDVQMDDMSGDNFGAKTLVIHVGSQNLRLGLATDALPKTVPMVIARKSPRSEAEDGEPRPKRLKTEDDPPEEWFGEEVSFPSFLFFLANQDVLLLTVCSLPKNIAAWRQTSRSIEGRTSAVCYQIRESW